MSKNNDVLNFLDSLSKENDEWKRKKITEARKLVLTEETAAAWFIFHNQDWPQIKKLESLIESVAQDEWGPGTSVEFHRFNVSIIVRHIDGRERIFYAPNRMDGFN